MPIKYDHVVASITKSHNTNQMTIAELQGIVESHVDKIHGKSEKPIEEALGCQVTLSNVKPNQREGFNRGRGYNNRGRGRGRGRTRGNYLPYNPGQGRGGDNAKHEKFQFHCFNCGKSGHKIIDCRLKKFNNNGNQANITENHGENSNESER